MSVFPAMSKNVSFSLFWCSTSSHDWHRRLGHIPFPIVQHAISSNKIHVASNKRPLVCPNCQMAKSHNLPFYNSTFNSSRPLYLIYSDVWGSCIELSTYGSHYYVCFLDDHTRFISIYHLYLKSDVAVFTSFQKMVE